MEDAALELHADMLDVEALLDCLVDPDDVAGDLLSELAGNNAIDIQDDTADRETDEFSNSMLSVIKELVATAEQAAPGGDAAAAVETPAARPARGPGSGRGGWRHGVIGGKRNQERASDLLALKLRHGPRYTSDHHHVANLLRRRCLSTSTA